MQHGNLLEITKFSFKPVSLQKGVIECNSILSVTSSGSIHIQNKNNVKFDLIFFSYIIRDLL